MTDNATFAETTMPPAPILNRVVSDAIFGGEEAIIWAINAPHPLVPESYKVIRMFIDLGSVEIYSMSIDGKSGMRNNIPTSKIRFTEEAMPLAVFGEELYAAEFAAAPVGALAADNEDDNDDQDEDEDSSDLGEASGPVTSNQPPS
jgi:hypothetical protein